MQSSDSKDKCTEKESAHRGRHDERSTVQDSSELVSEEVPNVVNRPVCLSANLLGKGTLS